MVSRRAEFLPDLIITNIDSPIIDLRGYADLPTLVTAIGADERIILISEDISLGANLSIPANIKLMRTNAAKITVNTGYTLTISGIENIIAGPGELFDGAGSYSFATGTILRVSWFSTLAAAVAYISSATVTLIFDIATSISGNLSVPATLTANFPYANKVITAATNDITWGGEVIAGEFQIISGSGTYTYNGDNTVYGKWVGGALDADFLNDVNVAGDIAVTGDIDGGNDITSVNDLISGNDLGVTGDSALGNDVLVGNDLTVTADYLSTNGDITLTNGELTAESVISTDDAAIVNDLVVGNDVIIGGSLSVVGSSDVTVGRGYIDGLIMSNGTDTSHDIDTTIGICKDAGNSENIIATTAFTKQIDVAWTAGDDAGGRADGVGLSGDTWYHYFILGKAYGIGIVDDFEFGFDTNVAAGNLLADANVIAAGFDQYRRIGSVLTDSSANIIRFKQVGNYFYCYSPHLSIDTNAQSTSEVLYTILTPIDVVTFPILHLSVDHSADCYLYVRAPELANEIPSETAAPLSNAYGIGGEIVINHLTDIYTDTSSQIAIRADAAIDNIYGAVAGYVDFRGKE